MSSNNKPHCTTLLNNQHIPVTSSDIVSFGHIEVALNSIPFIQWKNHAEENIRAFNQTNHPNNQLEIHGIEIQAVEFRDNYHDDDIVVEWIQMRVDCTKDGVSLPGDCFLRGNHNSKSNSNSASNNSVGVFLCLKVVDNNNSSSSSDNNLRHSNNRYVVLVEQQTRVIPIGCETFLELPSSAGVLKLEDVKSNSSGGGYNLLAAIDELLREECDIHIDHENSEIIDLTELVYGDDGIIIPSSTCSGGGGRSDNKEQQQRIRLCYLEKEISRTVLEKLDGRLLLGLLRDDHGEIVTMIRVVKMEDAWRMSKDVKVLCALQLLQQVEKDLPRLLQPKKNLSRMEPLLQLSDGNLVPQLAFGLYNVRLDECEEVVLNAIKAGYRHFDCASVYNNEAAVGRALSRSGIPRNEFFICSKVWNDAQKAGYKGVRSSFEKSLADLRCGYFDLYLVHWPVPGHHISTYKTLEKIYNEGKVKSIGLSNYTHADYEELIEAGITVPPVVNQIEVSPVMYRPELIAYFFEKGITVCAFKALNRGNLNERRTVKELAEIYSKSSAQIFLRWGLQKHMVVISKTSRVERMKENRDIIDFEISEDDMSYLNILTSNDDVRRRYELEELRKRSM